MFPETSAWPTYTFAQCDNGDGSAWIPLHDKTRTLVGKATVDASNWEFLMASHWWLSYGYAHSKRNGRNVKMHRLVTDCPTGLVVDHINHDRLDNRLENLKVVTTAENSQNHTPRPYRGTTQHPTGKWMAQVCVDYKNHYLGLYETREEAAEVARKFRLQNMTNSNG
jgi:hypothetical protein